MTITPYVHMSGNAEEAMICYQKVFGGTVEIRRWGDKPPDPRIPVADRWKDKVMHGVLNIRDGLILYFSDSLVEEDLTSSTRISLSVGFDTEDELRAAFNALSEDGTVNIPLEETSRGALYGDLVDTFGILWGFHYQLGR